MYKPNRDSITTAKNPTGRNGVMKNPRVTIGNNSKKKLLVSDFDKNIEQIMTLLNKYTSSEISKQSAKIAKEQNNIALKISSSTVYNWRRAAKDGGVRYPQYRTLTAALAVVGKEFKIVNK